MLPKQAPYRLDWRRLYPSPWPLRGKTDPSDHEVMRAIRSIPRHYAGVEFGVPFITVATSSTAKTVAGIKCPTNQAIQVIGFDIGFDGTNSTQGPATIEIGFCTFGANSPGTNSTSVTPVAKDNSGGTTIQCTAGKNWTTEPTTITVVEAFFIPVYMGSGIIFYPLTSPMLCKGGTGAVMRVTQQSGVTANATGTLKAIE